jgi:hypothetical protein
MKMSMKRDALAYGNSLGELPAWAPPGTLGSSALALQTGVGVMAMKRLAAASELGGYFTNRLTFSASGKASAS